MPPVRARCPFCGAGGVNATPFDGADYHCGACDRAFTLGDYA